MATFDLAKYANASLGKKINDRHIMSECKYSDYAYFEISVKATEIKEKPGKNKEDSIKLIEKLDFTEN